MRWLLLSAFYSTCTSPAALGWQRHDGERLSTPTTPEPTREMKLPSNCANRQCHAEGGPRELVLTQNEVKGKDGVVGVRVFGDALIYPRHHAFVSTVMSPTNR
jgi:hypothetical protein